MGDDCFLFKAGAPVFAVAAAIGSSGDKSAAMVSMGEGSGVCVECDEVVRGSRCAAAEVSHALLCSGSRSRGSPGVSFVLKRTLPFVAMPVVLEEYAMRRECGRASSGGDGASRIHNVGQEVIIHLRYHYPGLAGCSTHASGMQEQFWNRPMTAAAYQCTQPSASSTLPFTVASPCASCGAAAFSDRSTLLANNTNCIPLTGPGNFHASDSLQLVRIAPRWAGMLLTSDKA
jgi:hypothetical protein